MFDEAHDVTHTYRLLKHYFEEYGLSKKKLSISFDNATTNTTSIRELIDLCEPNVGEKFFHVRCAYHVLNLCIQVG